MRRAQVVLLALIGGCGLPTAASASPVTLIQHATYACLGSLDCAKDASLEFGARTIARRLTSRRSMTSINLLDTGLGALFDFDFRQTRNGLPGGYSYSFSDLTFVVGAQDATYEISGLYTATHGGAPGRVSSGASLLDRTDYRSLFRDHSLSENTENESFTLGVAGDGDLYNSTSVASLRGTLLAGHTYYLSFQVLIGAPDADSGATANGCVTLSIGGATGAEPCGIPVVPKVPEPSSASLLALAGAALTARRWRHQRRRRDRL